MSTAATQNQPNFNITSAIKEEPEGHDSITFEDYEITENYQNFTVKEEPEDYYEIVEVKNVDDIQPVVRIPFLIKTEEDCDEIYTKKLEIFSNEVEIEKFKIKEEIKIEEEYEKEFRVNNVELEDEFGAKNNHGNIIEDSKNDGNEFSYKSDSEYECHNNDSKYQMNESENHKIDSKYRKNEDEDISSDKFDIKFPQKFSKPAKKWRQLNENDTKIPHNVKTEPVEHFDEETSTSNAEAILKLVNHDHNYFSSTNTQIKHIKSDDDGESSENEEEIIKSEVRLLGDIDYKRDSEDSEYLDTEYLEEPVNKKRTIKVSNISKVSKNSKISGNSNFESNEIELKVAKNNKITENIRKASRNFKNEENSVKIAEKYTTSSDSSEESSKIIKNSKNHQKLTKSGNKNIKNIKKSSKFSTDESENIQNKNFFKRENGRQTRKSLESTSTDVSKNSSNVPISSKIASKPSDSNEDSSSSELNESSDIYVIDSDDSMDEDDLVECNNSESEDYLLKSEDTPKGRTVDNINQPNEQLDDDIESLDEDEDGIQYKEITFEEMNSFGIKKRRLSSISEESDSSFNDYEENQKNSKKYHQSSIKTTSDKSQKSKNSSKLPKNPQKLSTTTQKPPKLQKPSKNQPDQDEILKCPSCPMTFEDTLRLNRHKRLHVAPQHQCRNCLRKFKRKSMLKKHFCDIKCPTCPDVCTCRMETSNDCIICQTINFRYFVDYKQHMLAQHNEIVVCKICEKNNYTLFRHKQLGHQLVKYFRCDECTSVLKTREQLKYHKETHAKNFKCNKCEKVFSRRYLLRQHELTHENPKTFHCEICDKNFQRKYCLDNHMKVIHSDKKKEENYLKLQRERYGERSKDWLQCDKCLALFRNQHSHQRHMDQAHNNWSENGSMKGIENGWKSLGKLI